MQLQKISCPTCGASLAVPLDVDRLLCLYCSSQFRVQSGDGYIALKAIDKLGQAIQESSTQTQQKIGEGTQVTQTELRRLQINQEIATAQLQLSSVQTEIRTLERGDRNRKVNKQLRELQTQERHLGAQIATLQSVLLPQTEAANQSLHPTVERKQGKLLKKVFQWGCLGVLTLFLLCSGLAMLGSKNIAQKEAGKILVPTTIAKPTEKPTRTVSSGEVVNNQSKLLIPTAIPSSVPATAIGSVTVIVEAANIRGGPSLDADVESIAKKGTQLLVYSRSDDDMWLAIDNKGERWIAVSTVGTSDGKGASGILAGVTKNEVAARLKQHGLICGNIDLGKLYYAQNCKFSNDDFELFVVIYGATQQTVDFINSAALSFNEPDDSRALALFNIITSLPYAGAEPNNATNWVEQTLPTITENRDVRSNQFGGVNYQLFGWPKARNLQVGDLR